MWQRPSPADRDTLSGRKDAVKCGARKEPATGLLHGGSMGLLGGGAAAAVASWTAEIKGWLGHFQYGGEALSSPPTLA